MMKMQKCGRPEIIKLWLKDYIFRGYQYLADVTFKDQKQ